jgi:hypothetical protein
MSLTLKTLWTKDTPEISGTNQKSGFNGKKWGGLFIHDWDGVSVSFTANTKIIR